MRDENVAEEELGHPQASPILNSGSVCTICWHNTGMKRFLGAGFLPLALYLFSQSICYVNGFNKPSACLIRPRQGDGSPSNQNAANVRTVFFTDVGKEVGLRGKQCQVQTSPNCIFPMFDNTLHRWDRGGFCQVERLTGGACVGDADGDGIDDIYYARMNGYDILYRSSHDNINGTRFQDISEKANIKSFTKRVHSNGCLFVDIDNDGDLDIYVSTVGELRFLLFVNNGFGHFTEEAVPRGLANLKKNNKMTAGFSIAAADVDHDGMLDLLTTEWLPWLDKECDHPEAPVDTLNTTNVRLFINQGKGFFKDVSQKSGAVARMRAPREQHLTTQCDELLRPELQRLLSQLAAPYGSDESEDYLRMRLQRLLKWLTESGMTSANMKQTPNLEDPSGYVYYTIDTPIVSGRDRITIIGTSLTKTAIHMAVAHGGNKKPTVTSCNSSSQGDASQTANITMNLGAANDGKITIGIACIDEPSCAYDLMYMLHAETELQLVGQGNEACAAQATTMEKGWETEKIPQQTQHVEPWLKSEYFVNKAVLQMASLKYETKVIRATLRSLFRRSHQMDEEADSTLLSSPKQSVRQIPTPLDKTKHKPVNPNPNNNNGFSKRLHSIYNTYNPEKLVDKKFVPKLVKKYTGREGQLLKKLKKKYSPHKVSTLFSNDPEIWGMEFETFADGGTAPEGNNPGQDALGQEPMKQPFGNDKASMQFYNFPSVGAFLFGATFSDLDNDTFPDLIFSGDFGTSAMLWNKGDGTFEEGHFDFLEDVLDNSMGSTVGDWNMDGLLDVLFTSISISKTDLEKLSSVSTNAGMLLNFRGNHLYQNVGGRRFEDKTDAAKVRESGWGWGSFFFDMDNDGDLDVLTGNGLDDPETTDDDWAGKQAMKLYVNYGREEGYVFQDEARKHGIDSTKENRGTMTFDFDHDGDLDVLVINHGHQPSLYRNDGGNYYDWVRVKVQESSGRTSLGGKVIVSMHPVDGEVTKFVREIGNTAAFLGQSESIAHIGLGTLGVKYVPEIKIIWPPRWLGEKPSSVIYKNVPTRTTLVSKRKGFGTYNLILNGSATELGACLFGQAV